MSEERFIVVKHIIDIVVSLISMRFLCPKPWPYLNLYESITFLLEQFFVRVIRDMNSPVKRLAREKICCFL